MENRRDNLNIASNEIIIYKTEDGQTKIDLNLRMRLLAYTGTIM